MESCLFCGCENHFYEADSIVDGDTAQELLLELVELYDKFQNNSFKPKEPEPDKRQDDILYWQCW